MMTTGTATNPDRGYAAALPGEPMMALPTRRIVGVVTLVAIMAGAVWFAGAWFMGRPAEGRAGVLASIVVAGAAVGSILLLQPWKTRPIGLWMSFWLGGIILRLIATPALALLVYSAASPPVGAFGLAVGLMYLLIVLAEAAVIALHIQQNTPSGASDATAVRAAPDHPLD